MDNWLLVCVGCLFLIFMIIGFIRGAIKIIVSLIATIVTLVVVVFATPYVSDFLYKVTPVPDMIQEECNEILMNHIEGELSDGVIQKVKEVTGVDVSGVGIPLKDIKWKDYGLTEEQVNEVIGQLELPREFQIQSIKNAGLPEFMKEKLLENNNSEVYKQLGITSFINYVGAYLAKIVVDIIAFLVTFLVVTLVIRIIMYALNILGDLPVFHGLNQVAGAVLGMGTALVIVWVLFLIITLAYSSDFGKVSMEMIAKSPFLTFLYENNYIMNAITKFH